MPNPDRLLATIDRAIIAIRDTPGREGRVIDLSDVDDVVVAGDLHGQVGLLQSLLALADLAGRPRRHLVIQELIHGPYTYPDGSDKSHQMVDLFCALKCQYPNRVHYLMGNHELAQWTDNPVSKGDSDLNQSFIDGIESAYLGRGTEIYQAYRRLFAELPLLLRTPNRVVLTHSIPSARHAARFSEAKLRADPPREEEYRPDGCVSALVWGRDVGTANAEVFATAVGANLLITGHIPTETGYRVPNPRQLILDCSRNPAAVCLFPATSPLTQTELLEGIHML